MRISMSPEKSQMLLFTRRPTHRDVMVSCNLDGINIPRSSSARFLGVLFDEGLRWGSHLDELIRRVNYRVFLLRKLATKQSFRCSRYIVNLFNSLVMPVFTYGAPAYASMAGTHWKKLKSFHDKALKSFLRLPSFYKNCCDHAFVDPMEDFIKDSAKKRVIGILAASPFSDDLIQNYNAYKTNTIHESSLQILKPMD